LAYKSCVPSFVRIRKKIVGAVAIRKKV